MTTTLRPTGAVSGDTRAPAGAADRTAGTGNGPTDRLMRVAAVVGPVLLGAASVAWLGGDDHAELRGILMFWAMPFLVLAAYGLAGRLQGRSPVGRAVVTALIAIGACAGAGFATEINMVEHFGIERLMDQDTPSAMLALGLPGLLLPFGLVILGLLSSRHRTMSPAQGLLLAAGGTMFPMSRIPQSPGLAIVADLLLLAALAPAAFSARGADGEAA